MPRQGAPKPPPAPKPWRREGGGYRSADERFTIEAGGAGRWFLTDEGSLDELGLARTLGPYSTLDEAKAAAAGRRDAAADASPLASLLADAAAAPKRAPVPRRSAAARDAAGVENERVLEPEPEPAPEPPPRTWLDDLEESDRPGAVRARRLVEQLAALGVDDAQGVVRRDVLGRQPAIAAALLGRTIADAMRKALDPEALVRDARRAIGGPARTLADADAAALAAYAGFIAARVLEATLEAVTQLDRADGAGRDLPGWRLVERPAPTDGDAEPRRLIVSPSDVTIG